MFNKLDLLNMISEQRQEIVDIKRREINAWYDCLDAPSDDELFDAYMLIAEYLTDARMALVLMEHQLHDLSE